MSQYQIVLGSRRIASTDDIEAGYRYLRAVQAATGRAAYLRRTHPTCSDCARPHHAGRCADPLVSHVLPSGRAVGPVGEFQLDRDDEGQHAVPRPEALSRFRFGFKVGGRNQSPAAKRGKR